MEELYCSQLKNHDYNAILENSTQRNREYYLDNLRTVIILGLFLFHACEIYHIAEGFYIETEKQIIPTLVYNAASPWYMGVLFFIAGISAMHSIKRRSISQFCRERVKRVLVPLLLGEIFWVPWQSYWILKNHTDFHWTMPEAWKYFFSHGNLVSYGYGGEFTLSHLWFLLSLFVISIVCLPVLWWKKCNTMVSKVEFNSMYLIFIIMILYIVSYGTSDESTLKFIVYYVLGIILYDNRSFYVFLERNRRILMLTGILSSGVVSYLLIRMKFIDVFSVSYALIRMIWAISAGVMVLAVIGMGRKYLNVHNRVWMYLSNRSFAIYFVHMLPLIVVGYYVVTYVKIWYPLQIFLIMVGSIIITFSVVELLVYIKPIKELLRLKKIQELR